VARWALAEPYITDDPTGELPLRRRHLTPEATAALLDVMLVDE
jgi:hypothetical protein